MSQSPLKVAIAGLGTVGASVVELIQTERERLAARTGRPITVVAVSARSRGKDRGIDLTGIEWFDDPVAMAREADADLVIELIGGEGGTAREVVEVAIDAGRHVVTANKALLAHHGSVLARTAEARGVALAYEAAVAGGIPIVKGLKEGLAANRIREIHGILNGTCNFIITEMRRTGRSFEDVLSEAQALGYAEADPSFDVDGIDAAHKLALLTAIAFGTTVDLDSVSTEGIRQLSREDIDFAEALGYRIKLLAIARESESGVEQRVHPCMVPQSAPIAAIDGVFNAVIADGNFVDKVMFVGQGAGGGPTASAVVADVVDIARGIITPTFGQPATSLKPLEPARKGSRYGAYYLRAMVVDRPGVVAEISSVLKDHEVSIESLLQRGRDPGEAVPLVLTTHETEEHRMVAAIDRIANLDCVLEAPRVIRIEAF